MKLYTEFADWWTLLSAPEDYEAEAEHFWSVMSERAERPVENMLELGCGGGNNASFLKKHCRITLTDLSPRMLEQSRKLNPECEHIEGDMRTLRLDRPFDAVFVHDAVMYLLSEDELRATIETAYAHTSPGGVALIVPDCTRETFTPQTSHGGHDGDDGRALRYLEWSHDPDPTDNEYDIEHVYVLRTPRVRVEHDTLKNGLFDEATWIRLMQDAGFEASVETCPFPGGDTARCFIGKRP